MDKKILLMIAAMGIVASGSFAADRFDLFSQPQTAEEGDFEFDPDEPGSGEEGAGGEEPVGESAESTEDDLPKSAQASENDTSLVLARDTLKSFAALIAEARGEKKEAACSIAPKKFNAQLKKADQFLKSDAAQAVLGSSKGSVVPVGPQLDKLLEELGVAREMFEEAELAIDSVSDACRHSASAKNEIKVVQKYLKASGSGGFLADAKVSSKSGGVYKKISAKNVAAALSAELASQQQKLAFVTKQFSRDSARSQDVVAAAVSLSALHQISSVVAGNLNNTLSIFESETTAMEGSFEQAKEYMDEKQSEKFEQGLQKLQEKVKALEKFFGQKKIADKDLVKKLLDLFTEKTRLQTALDDIRDDADVPEPDSDAVSEEEDADISEDVPEEEDEEEE